ncbi:MAG: hypothetical protein RL268_507 [Pseudomonadota bacterium]|jgi:hypothetical protein
MTIHLHDTSADLAHKVLSSLVFALLGAGVGWAAQALTLSGRVAAIEHGMGRIEAQMERLIQRSGAAGPERSGTPIAIGACAR